MEPLLNLLQPDKLPIDFIIIFLVLLAGQFQKKYLFNLTMNGAWKTLVVSLVFTLIYAVLVAFSGSFSKDLPMRWFFSYVLATSLYELILKKFFDKYFPEAKTPGNDPQ
jgi:predicted branched-subunit amino acid permease